MRGDRREEIAERVTRFYKDDWQASNTDRDLRIQRNAKFRQWTEGKDWPWEDSSDQAIPDMMTASLRMQDTLHNAVMSTRPVIVSRAVAPKDSEKQDTVDELIDYQVFVEQSGDREALINLPAKFRGYFPPTKNLTEETACRQLERVVTKILEHDMWFRDSEHARMIRNDIAQHFQRLFDIAAIGNTDRNGNPHV